MGHPALLFDTHLYIKKLKTTGVSEAQAEVHAETLATLFEDRLTTKSDLENFKNHVDHQFGCIEVRFNSIEARLTDIESRVTTLEARMAALEARMTALEARMTTLEARMVALKADMETRFAGLKMDIIKWFLSISFTQAALVVSLIKFLH